MLGPIEQGEGEYGDELVRSLDVFIEHNGHWEKAAAALYCHRHTLRYRIRRIEQLTGRRLLERARPHRVLARAARTGAGAMSVPSLQRSAGRSAATRKERQSR